MNMGVRKEGFYTHPLSLIFYKNFITCAKGINCFRILLVCLFVDLMQIPWNEFACNFQETLLHQNVGLESRNMTSNYDVTKIPHQIQMTPYATEWNPPMKIFCVRHWLWTLGIGVMWEIFQESGNSPVVMHLLKNLDNHSDTMQLAFFKNLGGMSLGELLDFILRFLMRSWISYASEGVRNNEFFEFICLIKF